VHGTLDSTTMAMGVAARDVYEVPSSDDSINTAIVKFHSLRENIVVGGGQV
jgi:hypothetical protein